MPLVAEAVPGTSLLTPYRPWQPQYPYQNNLLYYLVSVSKVACARHKDRGFDESLNPVSARMMQGQMQLAMEETEERKDRDERVIR